MCTIHKRKGWKQRQLVAISLVIQKGRRDLGYIILPIHSIFLKQEMQHFLRIIGGSEQSRHLTFEEKRIPISTPANLGLLIVPLGNKQNVIIEEQLIQEEMSRNVMAN